MSNFSESIKLNNGNVLDTESSAIESLSSNLYNAIHNNMNTTSLFTNQNGGAAVPTLVGRKKISRDVPQKATRASSKGSKGKKTGSKKGSKKVERAGSKGSKKAGSKKAGSKKTGSKKTGSKKTGSKKTGSKRLNKNVQNVDMVGGRKSKGKRSSKSSRSKSHSANSLDSNIMSDSIQSFINTNTKSATKSAQDGGKKGSKKGSKKSSSKRQLPEKLQEFQKLIKHLSSSGLKHGPVLFTLAKKIRDEVPDGKNIATKDLTQKAMKLYDANQKKWAAEYEKIKVEREKTKGMKKK